jgi:3-isopropylmalate dehydratase small subunit
MLAMSLDKSKERVRPECEITLPCKEVIRAWGRAAACDKALLFMRARRRDDGSEDPSFVLNKPRFRNPGILVTGHNFGAGSSREAAVWGMFANDIRVIVARSFADIYRENCLQNGLLPVMLAAEDAQAFEQRVIAVDGAVPFTVDLNAQRISGPGGPRCGALSPISRRRTRNVARSHRLPAPATLVGPEESLKLLGPSTANRSNTRRWR